MKPPLLKIIVCVSYLLDFLVAVYFILVFVIIFFGGFSVVIADSEVSATSAYKPVATLLILFIVKFFVADFKKEIEKNKVLVSGTLILIFFLCEFSARVYYSAFVPQDLIWASENMVIDEHLILIDYME